MGGISRTPRCYRVLGRADEIARSTGSPYVMAEHLFLAIIHESQSMPAQMLAGLTDLDRVEAAVLAAAGQSGHPSSARPPRPELAGFKVAAEMGDSYVGVEHLLLALLRDRQAIPARALAALTDLGRVETAIFDAMASPQYRVPRCPDSGLMLPEGQELDEALLDALVRSLPEGARLGFNWDNDRPWIHVTEPGNNRDALNAALARLGRPGLN